jgi:hypothetical protein
VNILRLVESQAPSLLILNGPFYSKSSKTVSDSNYTDKSKNVITIDYIKHRYAQIREFIKNVKLRSPATEVMVLPDVDEIDSMYPLPIPKTVFGVQDQFGVNGASVGPSPALFSLEQDRIKVGYIGGDVIFDVLKKSKLKNVKKRIEQTMMSIVEQNHLYPVYPCGRPFDLSKTFCLSYPASNQPDLLFVKSRTKKFVEEFDGTVCVNFGSCVSGDTPAAYASVKIDAEALKNNQVS